MARKWRENGGLQMFIDSFLYFNYTHDFFYLFHSFFSLFLSLFFSLLKKKGDFSTLDKIRRCEGKFSMRGFLVANSPPVLFFFLFFVPVENSTYTRHPCCHFALRDQMHLCARVFYFLKFYVCACYSFLYARNFCLV